MHNLNAFLRAESYLVALLEEFEGYPKGTLFTTHAVRLDEDGYSVVTCTTYHNPENTQQGATQIIPMIKLSAPIEVKSRKAFRLKQPLKKDTPSEEYSRALLWTDEGTCRPTIMLTQALQLDKFYWSIYQDNVDNSLYLGVSKTTKSPLRKQIKNKMQLTILQEEFSTQILVAVHRTYCGHLPAVRLYRLYR